MKSPLHGGLTRNVKEAVRVLCRACKGKPLTGIDYIAAIGMTQSRVQLGYSAFMGKMGVSEIDAARAVSLLTDFALESCDKVAAFRKLDAGVRT
ncbi:hypothetical protein CRX72_20520 [Pantoea sp. BRM17]|nr:hypothetical protein CRX72_20520 [Pantoea sp. BRM17]